MYFRLTGDNMPRTGQSIWKKTTQRPRQVMLWGAGQMQCVCVCAHLHHTKELLRCTLLRVIWGHCCEVNPFIPLTIQFQTSTAPFWLLFHMLILIFHHSCLLSRTFQAALLECERHGIGQAGVDDSTAADRIGEMGRLTRRYRCGKGYPETLALSGSVRGLHQVVRGTVVHQRSHCVRTWSHQYTSNNAEVLVTAQRLHYYRY